MKKWRRFFHFLFTYFFYLFFNFFLLFKQNRKSEKMTDPIDADSVIPQAHEGSNDCFEEPPVDPNAFSFTGTWELHNYMVCVALSFNSLFVILIFFFRFSGWLLEFWPWLLVWWVLCSFICILGITRNQTVSNECAKKK